jgi:hypothetical protein
MTDTKIEIIENKLLHLALEGDREATRRYANLYLFRRTSDRTRSAEHQQNFLDQVHDAQTWLTANYA